MTTSTPPTPTSRRMPRPSLLDHGDQEHRHRLLALAMRTRGYEEEASWLADSILAERARSARQEPATATIPPDPSSWPYFMPWPHQRAEVASWLPASEPPPVGVPVLVAASGLAGDLPSHHGLATWNGQQFMAMVGGRYLMAPEGPIVFPHVTHWRPLPALPGAPC